MKKHLNTLYITTKDVYLHKEGMTFVVEKEGEKVFQAPVHTIENIVCFGFKPISPALMSFCAENDIGISYLSTTGRFLASVYGPQKGNVLLRTAQYKIADNEKDSLRIARNIVAAKITNYRKVIQRHLRNYPDDAESNLLKKAIDEMNKRMRLIKNVVNLNSLRGFEGDCSAIYFSCLKQLITSQKEYFQFEKRSKRPPLDNVNALLSFLYVILANDIRSAIETTGLDSQVGFLHRIRSGRPSLALDIMEEFRAYLADRVALNVINLGQVKKNDFEMRETGEIRINENARKTVIVTYQNRKQKTVIHPFLKEKTTLGMLPHIKAILMARYIRGDIEEYPPFYIK